MEGPRLGVELELQLPAYPTTTETQDPSRIFNLHHSSRQCWIPDPLTEARDQTLILMDTSRTLFCCATTGTPYFFFLNVVFLKFGSTWAICILADTTAGPLPSVTIQASHPFLYHLGHHGAPFRAQLTTQALPCAG